VEYRVEQLASVAGVSVDTIRFYQSRGLLPPPRRQGRVGWYDDDHRDRLDRIRTLQARGLTLATIRRLVSGELDAADEALVTAVSEERPEADVFGIEELAKRSGIPLALLQSALREGLLAPEWGGFTDDDVAAAKAGLALLEEGVPLGDLLTLAQSYHEATHAAAERAVELFDLHVRQPLRAAGLPGDQAANRLVAAFQRMLPATTTLVTHHFTRTLLAVAMEHIEQVGDDAELQAVKEAGG
jgi:DNA-binding transcriptional MerR regulator